MEIVRGRFKVEGGGGLEQTAVVAPPIPMIVEAMEEAGEDTGIEDDEEGDVDDGDHGDQRGAEVKGDCRERGVLGGARDGERGDARERGVRGKLGRGKSATVVTSLKRRGGKGKKVGKGWRVGESRGREVGARRSLE